MKIIAVNGSPRKRWNTATMLTHALSGAESQGADTELIHLYDYQYSGCTSCFACKYTDSTSYGTCAIRDGITPVLEKISTADALILGSPIYFGTMTGMMRSFTERLFFPLLMYSMPPSSLYTGKMKTAFIYTMNVAQEQIREIGYHVHIEANENVLKRIFSEAESLLSCETRQFEDYSKVVFSYCDPEERVAKAAKTFPEDCRKAFDLGVRLAKRE